MVADTRERRLWWRHLVSILIAPVVMTLLIPALILDWPHMHLPDYGSPLIAGLAAVGGLLIVGGLGVFHYQQTACLAQEAARWASVRGGDYQKDTDQASPTTQQILQQVTEPRPGHRRRGGGRETSKPGQIEAVFAEICRCLLGAGRTNSRQQLQCAKTGDRVTRVFCPAQD